MDLIDTLKKLALVMERADEFIEHNAPHLLPGHKNKLIDLTTISLMAYEDHVFHWDQLKNISSELVERHINHSPSWFIDISRSTSSHVFIKSRNGLHHLKMPIDLFLMTTHLAVN